MAEFISQPIPVEHPEVEDGFKAMGKPIPDYRRDEAYRTCRDAFEMRSSRAMGAVSGMAEQLERDNPYGAMEAAMKYGIDLTGTYRIMAVLLTHQQD